MTVEELQSGEGRSVAVVVHVNVQPVRVDGHHLTGRKIKDAAIVQGVNIRPDYALYLETAHGHTRRIRDDETVEVTDTSRFLADEITIEIRVNNKRVRVEGRHQTGLAIKQAAIAQGVSIKLDFLLYEDIGAGRTRLIKDDEKIEVTNHSKFDAVPDDDHS